MSNTNLVINNLADDACPEELLCSLSILDMTVQADPCNTVTVPINIEDNGNCIAGKTTLADLSTQIAACIGLSADDDVSDFTAVATSPSTATITVTEGGVDRQIFLAGTNVGFTGNGTALDPLLISAAAGGVATAITNGAGISVTGTGAAGDPYIITNTAPNQDTVVVDGANVTITGTGTAGDPYVINAAIASITPGNNVSVTGTGQSTNPYVISAELAEIQDSANNGLSQSGDGTSATPYALAVDATDLPQASQTDVNNATVARIVGELDGVTQSLPIPPAFALGGAELNLTVDGSATEVAGSVYNTILDAYNYAISVLQVGGILNITIPSGASVTETSDINVNGNRVRTLSITSDGTGTVTFQNCFLDMENGYFNSAGVNYNFFLRSFGMLFSRMNYVRLQNINFVSTNTGAPIFIGETASFVVRNVDGTTDRTFVSILGATGSVSNSEVVFVDTSNTLAVQVDQFGQVDVRGNTFTFPVGSTNAVGIRAEDHSRVITTTANTITNATTNHDPAANTNGNYMSRIVTVA